MGNQSKRLRSRPPKVGDVTKGNWYNFWDDQLIPGPGQIPLEASLEQIPLLVKAGSILTMEEEGHLTLHLSHPQQEPVSRFSTAMPEMAMVNIELHQVTIDGAEVGVEKVESDRPFRQVKIKGKIAE